MLNLNLKKSGEDVSTYKMDIDISIEASMLAYKLLPLHVMELQPIKPC